MTLGGQPIHAYSVGHHLHALPLPFIAKGNYCKQSNAFDMILPCDIYTNCIGSLSTYEMKDSFSMTIDNNFNIDKPVTNSGLLTCS